VTRRGRGRAAGRRTGARPVRATCRGPCPRGPRPRRRDHGWGPAAGQGPPSPPPDRSWTAHSAGIADP